MSDDILDSVLDSVANAKPSVSSNWLQPGSYTLEVQNLLFFKDKFVAELKVIESASTGEVNRKTGQPFVPNPVGSTPGYVVKLKGGDKDPGPGNIIAFFMGLTGAPKEKITRDVLRTLSDKELQPCRFMLVKDTPFNKPQKNNTEEDFTYHKWQTVAPPEANKKHREAIKPQLEAKAKAAAEAKLAAAQKAAQAPVTSADGLL